MSASSAAGTRMDDGAVSPALVTILADMVEAALRRDSKAVAGVASTQGQPAPSKESDTT